MIERKNYRERERERESKMERERKRYSVRDPNYGILLGIRPSDSATVLQKKKDT